MTALQRRAFLLAPLGIAALGGTAFWLLLERMREGTYDPHGVPSMLIGKPLPRFSLPGQPPGEGFSSADVVATGRPALINKRCSGRGDTGPAPSYVGASECDPRGTT